MSCKIIVSRLLFKYFQDRFCDYDVTTTRDPTHFNSIPVFVEKSWKGLRYSFEDIGDEDSSRVSSNVLMILDRIQQPENQPKGVNDATVRSETTHKVALTDAMARDLDNYPEPRTNEPD